MSRGCRNPRHPRHPTVAAAVAVAVLIVTVAVHIIVIVVVVDVVVVDAMATVIVMVVIFVSVFPSFVADRTAISDTVDGGCEQLQGLGYSLVQRGVLRSEVSFKTISSTMPPF